MGNICSTPRADESEAGGVLQLDDSPPTQQNQLAPGFATRTENAPAPASGIPLSMVPANEYAEAEKQQISSSAFEQACSGSKLESLAVEYLSKEVSDGRAVYGEEIAGDSERQLSGTRATKKTDYHEGRKVRWQQGELIGAGAFGRVYLGLNLDTGQLMAVKQVSIARDFDVQGRVAEHVRNLEAEVHVLKQLHHPNIVQYLGTERCMADMTLNIFLEFVPGGSIASLLAKFGSFTESVIRVYTKQILLGLEFLHTHQIMHRDIKGANILVDNSGVVKLADFGASKKIEDLVTVDSGFKSIKGTPYWMAPEVITQTGHGRQADIWSVGCTVIEMATGKPPWSQHFPVPMSAMFAIANSKSPPPLPDHLSPEARDFLLLCFKRVPKERPNATRLLQHPFLSAAMNVPTDTPPRTSSAVASSLMQDRQPTARPPVDHPPLAGTGFKYAATSKPLSPVTELNSLGVGTPLGSTVLSTTVQCNTENSLGQEHTSSSREGGSSALVHCQQEHPSTDPGMDIELQNESLALTVESAISSISYNPVDEPPWLQPNVSGNDSHTFRGDEVSALEPICAGKENSDPSVESHDSHQQGDEANIMAYVREKAYRETSRLSTPFFEQNLRKSDLSHQSSTPACAEPQILELEVPKQKPVPPRPRMGRPVRPKTHNERMARSRQWEVELEQELEAERQKTKTPRTQPFRNPADVSR